MSLTLRHPGTGGVKVVPTGFSWSLFLGAGLLGLPLFFRGLPLWGTVMLAAWAVRLAVPAMALPAGDADALGWALSGLVGGLSIFLGLRGNALSAAHYIACGWEPAERAGAGERFPA